jgi:hypothetical protein
LGPEQETFSTNIASEAPVRANAQSARDFGIVIVIVLLAGPEPLTCACGTKLFLEVRFRARTR